jgi:hypothetical protein
MTSDPAATIEHASGEQQLMQCMEVWGGNDLVDANVSMPGLDAWVFSKPYEQAQAGGDVYYVSACATGRITRLLVADVAGHGANVRDTAITLRNLMRRYVNHIDQTRFVRSMNEQFAGMSKAGTFATAVVTTFFAPTNMLTLCNAGHPSPLLYRAKRREWSILSNRDDSTRDIVNIPLGIEDAADYRQFGASLDEMVQMRSGKPCKLVRMGLEPVEKLSVADQGNLHGLGHACSLLAGRQRIDKGAVVDDRPRRRKSADEILQAEMVDGILDADATVILGQNRARKTNVADAAMKDSGGMADCVEHRTSSDRKRKGMPVNRVL